MPAETRSMISVTRRGPVDPFHAELDQWQARTVQAINDAADAALHELHAAFDQATIARDRICDITQRQRPSRVKPKPTILDAEVALVHELAAFEHATSQLVDASRQVEADGDLAMTWCVQMGREVSRLDRRFIPTLPAPEQEAEVPW